MLGPPLVALASGTMAAGPPAPITVETPVLGLIAAGLLVGYGTRLGNGCTSGHGICGLARLSVRSAVAVGVFMATAAVTVFVTRRILGV